MWNRGLLYGILVVQSAFALDVSPKIPLQIEGSNIYKIFEEKETTAFATLEIFAENEPGEYIIEVLASSGVFSSGLNKITYDLSKTPLFDIQNKRYVLYVAETEVLKQLQLVFTLPSQMVLSPGTYTTEIPIKIFKGKEVVNEKKITAYFNVDEQITAKLLMDGLEQESEKSVIRFGNVSGEMERDFSFYVQSNAAVKVTITSKNNGRMLLDEENGDQSLFIPYTLQRDGGSLSFIHESIHKHISNVKVLLHPDMQKTFCGKYRDRINITISSY